MDPAQEPGKDIHQVYQQVPEGGRGRKDSERQSLHLATGGNEGQHECMPEP